MTSRTIKQAGSAPVTTTTTIVKTNGNIEDITDEEILKKLVSKETKPQFDLFICFTFYLFPSFRLFAQLEQATSYEERRKLRARIKQVMADKEGESGTTMIYIVDGRGYPNSL